MDSRLREKSFPAVPESRFRKRRFIGAPIMRQSTQFTRSNLARNSSGMTTTSLVL
jgi:hypothetical protein